MLDPAFYTAPVILPGPSTVPAVNGQAPSWNTDGTFAGWTSAGLTSGPLSQFAATTSFQLAGVITDETGTGLLVFGTSPTLVTPLIGTPASGVLTNCTGLPLTTGVTGTLGHLNLGSGGGGAIKFLREDSTYQTITLSPPAGTGTELQYRVNATTFGAVPDTFVVGGNIGIGATPLVKFQVNVGTNQNIWLRSSLSNPNISFANDGGAAFVTGSIDGLTLVINAATLGNVGIGAPAVGATLHVHGNTAVLKLTDTGASGHTYWLYPRASAIAGQFGLYDETAGAYRWLVDANGNFGVGTLLPISKLDIRSSNADKQIRLGDVSGDVFTYTIGRSTSTGYLNFDGYQSGAIGYVFNSGNVGIGVIPTSRLQVAGEIVAEGSLTTGRTASGLYIYDTGGVSYLAALTTGGSAARDLNIQGQSIIFQTGTAYAEKFRMDTVGNLGIGQVTFGTLAVKVLAHGNGTAPSTSPADAYQLYSADQVAGNACPHFRTENGGIIKLFQTGTYTPTNVVADRTYDANATNIDELADVLGTLIADLKLTGLVV